MADTVVDTTAPAYNVRRQQFADIQTYYGPILKDYLNATEDRQTAMRQHDIFLREILEFIRKFNENDTEGLLA